MAAAQAAITVVMNFSFIAIAFFAISSAYGWHFGFVTAGAMQQQRCRGSGYMPGGSGLEVVPKKSGLGS
jgi:hypothetical protein